MNDRKDIGKAFKEKLNQLQTSPQDLVWDNIVAELDKKNKKRRIIPIWFKIGGVAASLLIGGLVLLTLIINDDVINNNKTNNSKIEIVSDNKIKTIKDNSLKTDSAKKSNKSIDLPSAVENNLKNQLTNSIKKAALKSNSNYAIINNKNIVIANRKTFVNRKKSITPNNFVKEVKNDKAFRINQSHFQNFKQKSKNSVYNKIQWNKNNLIAFTFARLPKIKKVDIASVKKQEKSKSQKKSWNVSIKAAPVFYGSLDKGSSINPQFSKNAQNSYTTVSYGFQTSLRISDKMSFRTGISTVELAYNTKKVTESLAINSQNIDISNSDLFNEELSLIPIENIFDLTQKINYLEIPLELSYKLINKKIEVDIITGVSTLILNENSILIDNKTTIGSVNNLNKLSFTGNLGFGFAYKITKKINVSVEPIFKLQFKTYKDNTNFKPYYFGIYSGFTYSF